MLVPMTKVQILGPPMRSRARGRRASAARPRGDRRRAGSRRSTSCGGEELARARRDELRSWRRGPTGCWRRFRRRRSGRPARDLGRARAGSRTRCRPSWSSCRPGRVSAPAPGRASRRAPDPARLPRAAPAAAAAGARARRPRRRAAPPAATGYGRARPQHGRRAVRRHAARALAEELGERFALSGRASTTAGSAVWWCSRTPRQRAVQALLGRAQVRQAALPEAFERLSLRAAVEAMQRRLRSSRRRSPPSSRARGAPAPACRAAA